MNFTELKTSLKVSVKPIYLVFGADNFLVQKAIDLITDAADVADKTLGVTRFHGNAAADQIVTACRTVSFFGGRKVVIVRPFEAEQQTGMLKNYLESPSMDCVLILVWGGEASLHLKYVEEVNCNPIAPEILVKLIANQLAAAGKKVSYDAANLLCEYCGRVYGRIDNEINKLVNFYKDIPLIGVDEVKQICTKVTEYQIYELAKAICAGKVSLAEDILRTLQDSGVEDYAVFGSLVGAFRRLFYSLTTKAEIKTVAAVLNCSPYAVQYARRDDRRFTDKIGVIYEYALDLEYQIKSGKVLVADAIVMLMMECNSAIS